MRNGTNLADYFGRLQGDLSAAVAILLWICALLFTSGGLFESPLAVRVRRLTSGDHRIVWLGLCLVVLAFVTGDLVFDGAKIAPDTRPSLFGAVAAIFVQILPGMTILLFANSKWRRRTVFVFLLIAAECCILIVTGRRVLIYGLAIAFLASAIGGLRFKLSWEKKAVLALVAIVLVAFGFQFFFAMRITSWRLGDQDASIGRVMASTLETMSDKDDSSINEALAENLRDRTSIILYLSDLIAASKVYPPLYGQDAVYCVKRAIPSALYANKEDVLFPEETLANPRFGLIIEDDPNSILTTGVSDFGVFGCFAYPLLSVACLRLLLWVLRSRASEAGYALAIIIVLNLLLQAENGGPSYVEAARNIVIVALAITLLKKWPALRKQKTANKGYLPVRPGADTTVAPASF
jgi:hypothetical protein